MKNKVLSLILVLALLLGFTPNLSMVYAASNNEHSDAIEIESKETKIIDGQIYKVFEINDLKVKDVLESERLYSDRQLRSAGDKLKNWQLQIDWFGRGESEFPFPAGGMEVTLMQGGTSKVFGKVVYPKDKINTATGIGTPVPFLEVENVNPDELGDTVKLGIPDSVTYDSKVYLEGTPQFGSKITASFKQKVNPLFKSEWHIKDADKPSIYAYVIDTNDKTAKMEFDVPKNDSEIYSIFNNEFTRYYDGTSLKPVVTGDDANKGRNEDYSGAFGKNNILLGNAADPSIEFGYGETKKKNNTGYTNVNNKKYLLNVFGNHLTMKRFAVYEALKVKFNTGEGKLEGGTKNADIGQPQEIGYDEKIDNNESGRKVTIPNETIKPPKVKVGDKEVDAIFAGWATKAQTLTDGKLSAIEGQLVNADGSLTDAGKTYTFTKDETILYAVFEAEKPGKVNIKYVNETNGDLLKADPSVKIDNEGYPEDKTGIEGQVIEAALTNTSGAPKFIGYKIKSVKLQKGDQDTSDQIKYTKNGDYTVVFVYEKLDDIIPEKDDNGQPNPKVTDDVKETYIPVTWKIDSEKGKFKKGEAAVAGTEFTYYVNPTKKKTFSNVVEESGLTAASKDENKYKIDTENPSTFNPEKVKATDEEQKPSLVVDNGTEINKLHFTVEKGLVVTVNFEQTKADQLKDKLDPKTIKVWVDENDKDGSKIDWKKGVKLKEDDKDLQKILDEDTTIVTDESNRNSSKQNLPEGTEGTLKVTFSDGSSIKVENQMLYVADHKVPIKDGDETNKINPDNLPTDKIAVKFLLGEGVKIGNDKVGDGTTPVLYETYYVKPNTSLEQGDIPATTLQENYRDNAWYNGTAKLAEADYKNITEAKEFIAKAEQTDAKKYGDQLKGQDIVKWVGDNPVDWKDGVKPIKGVTFKNVADLSNRSTDNAGVFLGKLKVTFGDDSTKEIDGQKLIVRAKKGEKVTPDDKDPGTYPKDALEVKFVAGTGIKALNPANKVMVLQKDEKLEEKDYPTVTLKDDFKTKAKNTDYYDVQPNTALTAKVTTITANAVKKGDGSATVEYHVGTENITTKIADLKIDGQTYPENNKLTGTEDTKIDTTTITQPELLGYKIVNITTDPETDAKYTEAGTAKVIFNYEKIDDIIGPVKPGDEKLAGYVTVTFKDVVGAKLDDKDANISYFVNPKAEQKAKVKLVGDKYQISGTKVANPSFTADIPVVKEDSGYELKYAEGSNDKWAYDNFDKVDNDITTNLTFTAQVIKLGDPVATYPPVEIEKGGKKESNPTIKDKKNKDQKPTEDPKILDPNDKPIKPGNDGKITIGDPEKGIKITPKKDKDGKPTGTLIVEVPENYDGPNTVVVPVEVTIPGDVTIKTKLEITIGKPEEPKPASPAITWRGLWFLGDSKSEPVQEMETGRHYKYLYGYVDKTVRPEGMITRSEAAALIARLANLDMTDKTKPNFKDTPSAWYNGAINAMVAKNLMFADKDGNFRPNEPITRGEFARALYYIDKKNDKVAPFADVKGHEFEDAINQAYGNGRIAGYQDGTFKPNANIQRAEAARILNQYADRNVTLAGMANVKNDLVRFTDINESHWAYCEVMEAANSHEYQRAKGTLAETWLKILDK